MPSLKAVEEESLGGWDHHTAPYASATKQRELPSTLLSVGISFSQPATSASPNEKASATLGLPLYITFRTCVYTFVAAFRENGLNFF